MPSGPKKEAMSGRKSVLVLESLLDDGNTEPDSDMATAATPSQSEGNAGNKHDEEAEVQGHTASRKRGRCTQCERSSDKKVRITSDKCHCFDCAKHSQIVCNKCSKN